MSDLPKGWSSKDNMLTLSIECRDFLHAVALLNCVADIAEELQHHPDIYLKDYNKLLVTTTTHDSKSLTEKDYTLAKKITEVITFEAQKYQIENFGR